MLLFLSFLPESLTAFPCIITAVARLMTNLRRSLSHVLKQVQTQARDVMRNFHVAAACLKLSAAERSAIRQKGRASCVVHSTKRTHVVSRRVVSMRFSTTTIY